MITIKTNINKEGIGKAETFFNSSLKALTKDPLDPLLSGDFVINHYDVKEWNLDTAQGTAFSLDVMTLINNTLASEVAFIMINSGKVLCFENDTPIPYNFDLSINGNSIGKCSQFQIMDMKSSTIAQLVVSNIIVPTDQEGILTVIIGLKK